MVSRVNDCILALAAVGTPYEGGTFQVKLALTQEYPAAPPKGANGTLLVFVSALRCFQAPGLQRVPRCNSPCRFLHTLNGFLLRATPHARTASNEMFAGYFLTKIFHPNVGPTGDICVNTLKKDWKSDVTLSHVLQVVRCLLIVPFPESSLNDDAGKLFMENYAEYARKARLMTSIHAMPAGSSASTPVSGARAAAAAGGAGAPAAGTEGSTVASGSASSAGADGVASSDAISASTETGASEPAGASAARAGSALTAVAKSNAGASSAAAHLGEKKKAGIAQLQDVNQADAKKKKTLKRL